MGNALYNSVSDEIPLQSVAGTFSVRVKNAVGDKKSVIEGVSSFTTIVALREMIALATQVEVERQRLFVAGRVIGLEGTLGTNNISADDWIQLMPRSKKAEAAAIEANEASVAIRRARTIDSLGGDMDTRQMRLAMDMEASTDDITRLQPTIRILAMMWLFFATVQIVSLMTHEIIPLLFGGANIAAAHRKFIGKHYHVHKFGSALMGMDFVRNLLGAGCALTCLSATRVGTPLLSGAAKLRAALFGTIALVVVATASQSIAAAINVGQMPTNATWSDAGTLALRICLNGAPEVLFYGATAFVLRKGLVLMSDAVAAERARRVPRAAADGAAGAAQARGAVASAV
jgi:hypothetical protein